MPFSLACLPFGPYCPCFALCCATSGASVHSKRRFGMPPGEQRFFKTRRAPSEQFKFLFKIIGDLLAVSSSSILITWLQAAKPRRRCFFAFFSFFRQLCFDRVAGDIFFNFSFFFFFFIFIFFFHFFRRLPFFLRTRCVRCSGGFLTFPAHPWSPFQIAIFPSSPPVHRQSRPQLRNETPSFW